MRIPNGSRSDSTWIPNASRAGALHSHIHSHIHSRNPGEARIHRHLGETPRTAQTGTAPHPDPATMDGRSAASIDGGQP